MLESPAFNTEKEKSAEKVDRTPDLMIFSHTLSQLSYLGTHSIFGSSCHAMGNDGDDDVIKKKYAKL